MTDPKVSAFWGPSKYDEEAPVSKTFSGRVDYDTHTFRLLADPYSQFTYMQRYKTIYNGRARVWGGICHVGIWIRPSAFGIFALTAVSLFTLMAIRKYLNHTWDADWRTSGLMFLAVWGVFGGLTVWEVKKARKIFEPLFPDSSRPETPGVSPP